MKCSVKYEQFVWGRPPKLLVGAVKPIFSPSKMLPVVIKCLMIDVSNRFTKVNSTIACHSKPAQVVEASDSALFGGRLMSCEQGKQDRTKQRLHCMQRCSKPKRNPKQSQKSPQSDHTVGQTILEDTHRKKS